MSEDPRSYEGGLHGYAQEQALNEIKCAKSSKPYDELFEKHLLEAYNDDLDEMARYCTSTLQECNFFAMLGKHLDLEERDPKRW